MSRSLTLAAMTTIGLAAAWILPSRGRMRNASGSEQERLSSLIDRVPHRGAMSRPYTFAIAAVMCLAASWVLSSRTRTHNVNSRDRRVSDDCAIDECGPDGLPLNAYAG